MAAEQILWNSLSMIGMIAIPVLVIVINMNTFVCAKVIDLAQKQDIEVVLLWAN